MSRTSGDKNKDRPIGAEEIRVVKARTHNLKEVSVSMPRNRLITFTGLSGSGKSSLAFDTIFAEGQRRYIESLSAYARQFLRQMQKPDVDEIHGLSPAISIDQKSRSNNPRSTVATVTEIYDHLRILFARVGRPYCLTCGREIQKLSNEEIKNLVLERITENLSKKESETDASFIEVHAPVVRGRKGEYYQLLYDLLGKGFGEIRVDGERRSLREKIVLSRNKRHEIDVLVDDIEIGEIRDNEKEAEERLSEAIEVALAEAKGLVRIRFVNREGETTTDLLLSSEYSCPHDGYSYPEIEPRLFSFNSPYGACEECKGTGAKYLFSKKTCPACNGARLRPEALNVFINGKNIVDVTAHSIKENRDFFASLELSEREESISRVVIKEIEARLDFMDQVGIEYLTLDRRAHTLSGGEAQRIRLASQLGSGLVGALYVLDEPTIGLHPRDNTRLIRTLQHLRDLGNTIIVVEHDEETIFSSDYLVDIGPGAGVHGGTIVASGYLTDLLSRKDEEESLTLQYLKGERSVPLPSKRRNEPAGKIIIRGGSVFNIHDLNVDIPLGRFCAVTGVSGSGKSSFVYEILHKNLKARLSKRHRSPEVYNCERFSGTEYLGREVSIDQAPIGRTPRSNPVTYTGAFTFIRELFSETSEARVRGWKPGRFSFNVKGGRCETCKGNGVIEVEMHFLPTVYVPCDVCKGRRYTKETLEITYKNKNIYEVLQMTVEEALDFFIDIPAVYDRLKTLNDVGLGYVKLGQSATTLSGGEAQRVKISSELFRQHIQKTLYILDEPTIGLHYEDVAQLIEVLQRLVDKGNTVVVIEHNLDLIKSADYIIDIGPEGGEGGGSVVAKGTPEQVAEVEASHTGAYLKPKLKEKKKKKRT